MFLWLIIILWTGVSAAEDLCPVSVENRFLMRRCTPASSHQHLHATYITMSCIGADIPGTFYNKTMVVNIATRQGQTYVSARCPEDPLVYQACGVNRDVVTHQLFPTAPYCGAICKSGEATLPFTVDVTSQECYYEHKLVTHVIPTAHGGELEIWVKEGGICNGICDPIHLRGGSSLNSDLLFCVDERDCGGYSYGQVVKRDSRNYCFAPFNDCQTVGLDSSIPTCIFPYKDGITNNNFVLYNGSRCFAPLPSVSHLLDHFIPPTLYWYYCTNTMDQTNCSDPSRVGGSCLVGGFPSNVSIYTLCGARQLCDDGMEGRCHTINQHCTIHKHRLCDGADDCVMGSDERLEVCSKLTASQKCTRGFSLEQGPQGIPVDWIRDGEVDCMDGMDETETWEMCGSGTTRRIKYFAHKCADVFMCRSSTGEFLELGQLCSFINNCD